VRERGSLPIQEKKTKKDHSQQKNQKKEKHRKTQKKKKKRHEAAFKDCTEIAGEKNNVKNLEGYE